MYAYQQVGPRGANVPCITPPAAHLGLGFELRVGGWWWVVGGWWMSVWWLVVGGGMLIISDYWVGHNSMRMKLLKLLPMPKYSVGWF